MLSTSPQLVSGLGVWGMDEVDLGMLLIIYNPKAYTASPGSLGLSVVIVLVMVLLAFAVAFLFPSKRAKAEELAREERIKAQSRQRRAYR